MNRNILAYFTIFLFVGMASCKKFLDQKPDNSLVTPSSVSDLQGLLDDETMMNVVSPSYGESSTDDYFYVSTIYNAMPVAYQDWYTWQKFDYTFGNDWSATAPAIYNCNLSLETLAGINRNADNAEDWDNVEGSALFFRSYYFLGLLWDYAKAYDSTTASKDLGIIMRLHSDYNIPAERFPVEQCYNQLIQDTKTAAALLPQKPLNEMRPSKGAAYGLLARAYLSVGNYTDALLYADSCLQINNSLMDYNNDPQVNINSYSPFKQFNKETIFYSEMNYWFDLPVEYNGAAIDSALYASYSDNDLRKIAFFMPLGISDYVQFKGSYSGNMDKFFTGITTAEIYLIKAECEVREGDIADGMADINTLLVTRYKTGTYVPYQMTSQDSALTIVLKERRKELLMRGLRWIDIKRLNVEGRNIILKRVEGSQMFTLQPNAAYYALPFPIDIIRQTGIQQN